MYPVWVRAVNHSPQNAADPSELLAYSRPAAGGGRSVRQSRARVDFALDNPPVAR
jgi:hypothetical protein